MTVKRYGELTLSILEALRDAQDRPRGPSFTELVSCLGYPPELKGSVADRLRELVIRGMVVRDVPVCMASARQFYPLLITQYGLEFLLASKERPRKLPPVQGRAQAPARAPRSRQELVGYEPYKPPRNLLSDAAIARLYAGRRYDHATPRGRA